MRSRAGCVDRVWQVRHAVGNVYRIVRVVNVLLQSRRRMRSRVRRNIRRDLHGVNSEGFASMQHHVQVERVEYVQISASAHVQRRGE